MFRNHKSFILKIRILYNQNNQKGVIILLAVIIMGLLLSIALGVSTILLKQLAMFKNIENSLQAFYAADTGIEEVLFCYTSENLECSPYTKKHVGDNEKISYSYSTTTVGGYKEVARSIGSYQKTKRSIEITLRDF